ncbi:MAG TPA: LON peptidase substrate-binding domain-containing protein, partial [Chloroflexia bacterium]|nr:LON peptidase substrate-binding domain-containing protein [Chloroflexia bacterium]
MDADQESVLLANNAGGEVLVEPTDVGKLKVPVLPLIDGAIFPKSVFPLTLRGEQAETLVAAARQAGGYVAVFQQRSRAGEVDSIDDLHRVGTLSRLTDVRHGEHGTIEAEAVGAIPVRLASVLQWDPHISAEVEPLHRQQDDANTVARLREQAALLYRQLLERDPSAASRLLPILDEAHNGDELAYLIGSTIPISPQARQSLLELRNTSQRLARVITYLKKALDLGAAQIGRAAIAPEAPHDQASIDLAELEIRIEGAGMSPEAEKVASRELDRLATLTTASPDYNLVRTYLQTLADLPWRPSPEGDVDLGKARTLLDREHYGVADVKNRILEHLAVRKLRSERAHDNSGELVPHTLPSRQPVLCLLGPPGVGKTSLGRSIAAALDRPFVRISLGGVTDEAEIRGHRRTYLGAMPGRIMQALLRTGSNRPVIMLDELDKIGPGPKGDPAAAVLDVLDLEQQREFVDLYIDVPFDISRIMFIATANTLDGMPDALRDRLEI